MGKVLDCKSWEAREWELGCCEAEEDCEVKWVCSVER